MEEIDYIKHPKPDNYLVWAILTTILCCLPFGIVSIVYASKVDNLYYSGQYEEAVAKAKAAKTWAIVSAVTALAFFALYLIAIAVVGIKFGAFDNL